MPQRFTLILIMLAYSLAAGAQVIKGEVVAMEDKHPISGVTIDNIHTSLRVSTNDEGSFFIAGSSDQLLEFNKPGYKTARVRIPKGYIPSYFKIILQKGFTPIEREEQPHNNRYDPTADSLKYRDIYGHVLDFPKMSTLDVINHPFSAMSKQSQQIWRFQDNFDAFQKEKYVDRTFNADIISRVTGLTGDSLHTYMRRYKPNYEQLRAMNDYNFYNYIKGTARHFRNRQQPRNSQ